MLTAAFLAVLGVPPAQADPVQTIHHCTGSVRTAEGDLLVHGYGAQQELARTRARAAGRQLAARHLSSLLWPDLLQAQEDELGERLKTLEVDAALGVPGASWVAGRCDKVKVATTLPVQATVDETVFFRADPGVAASEGYRLRCERAYTVPVTRVFQALSMAPANLREKMLDDAMEGVRTVTAECYAQPASFSPVDRAVPVQPTQGTVECLSMSAELEEGPMGRAWGPDADTAADLAAWERSTQDTLGGLSAAFIAVASASAETRTMLVAEGLTDSVEVPTQATTERALTLCHEVKTPTPTLAWTPSSLDTLQCSKQGPGPLSVPDGASPEPVLAEACTAIENRSLDQARRAVARASEEMLSTLRAAGWASVLECSNACRRDNQVVEKGEARPLPDVPPRTEAALAAALDAAAKQRSLPLLFAVAPGLDNGRMGWLVADDPDRFWGVVAEVATQMGTGEAPDGFRIVEIGDHAVLLMAN